MVRTSKRSLSLSHRIIFILGACLLLVGIGGLIIRLVQGRQFVLADIVSPEVTTYVDLKINKDLQTALTQLSLEEGDVMSYLSERLSLGDLSWEEWFSKRVFVSFYDEGEVIFAFPKKGKRNAKALIERISLSGEQPQSLLIGGESFFSPGYSSFVTAGNVDGYVVVGSSRAVLEEYLVTADSLSENTYYQALDKNVPRSSFMRLYGFSSKYTPWVEKQAPDYVPLYNIAAEALPVAMVSLREEKGLIALHTNIHALEGVFADIRKEKRPRQTLPALAKFAPKNVLFFMNGTDVAYKYEHTKKFLSQFHPQFSILFEGIIKAESQRLLGDDFDVERDFLSQLSGQYATIVHGFPQLHMTLVSDIRTVDREQMLSGFHEAVRKAQSHFSTKTETVELPDGTTREELVALDPREVVIGEKTFEGVEYFVAQSVSAEQQFSYGIVDGYFVFSSHEEGLQSVIASYKGGGQNLGENADFRESVLFSFSPSESYGFVHVAKWREVFQSLQGLLEETEDGVPESSNVFFSFLEGVRTASFARKVYPDQVIVDLLLFGR